ncbi:MAG: PAS domain-containing protein [Chloroherpetonaceae bacterium]|nr:PAS domain-containing protein [Chloroherpetonaceae bacterium]
MQTLISTETLFELANSSQLLLGVLSKDGHFIEVSDAWVSQMGYQRNTILGKHFSEFLHPEDIAPTLTAAEDLIEGKPLSAFENRYRDFDGNYRWFQWAAKYDQVQEKFFVMVRDISLNKFTEKKLRSAEKRHQIIVDNMFHMIGLLSPDGILLEANKAALTFGGIPPTEVIGKYFWDCYWWQISKDAQDKLKQGIHQAANGSDVRFEVEVQAKGKPHLIDFSLKPLFDDEGKVEFIIPEGRSLVAQRQGELHLKEREAFLKSIYYGAEIAIFVIDVLGIDQYRVREVNPAYERMAHLNAVLLEGKLLDELAKIFSPEAIVKIKENYRKAIEKRERIAYEESMIMNGRQTYWMTQLAPLFDENGQAYRIIGTSLEVTEQKKIEEEKRQLERLQSQKMEALGTLSSGIAHDFNNILSIITLASERMKMKKTIEAMLHSVEIIRTATERGKEVVQQLSLFSRSESLELIPIAITEVFKQVNVMLRASMPRNIDLEFQQASSDLYISGNHTNLCQILLNLAVNARDAMPNGGMMRIQSFVRDEAIVQKHFPEAKSQNGFIEIRITDTGTGISEDVRARMFEPFFTTKQKGKGTGLGLSIVHGVVKAHKGFIDVQSQVGKGTVFSLYFPLLAKANFTKELETEIKKGVLLLVEDEIEINNMLSDFLEHEGYAVFKAFDGLEASNLFKLHKDKIDLVITDSDLPKLSGRDLIQQFRRINPKLPIIIASGSLGIREFTKEMEGATAFIEKPYVISEILSNLDKMIES